MEEFPEKHLDNNPQVGWIADDLKQVFPELVTTDSEGFMAVSYSRSASILAQAIKELKEKYEKRINDLEAKLNALPKCSGN